MYSNQNGTNVTEELQPVEDIQTDDYADFGNSLLDERHSDDEHSDGCMAVVATTARAMLHTVEKNQKQEILLPVVIQCR